jgi:hypothetical protein
MLGKSLLLALIVSGCGLGTTVKETEREIKETSGNTEKLVEATHKQILTVSLEQMLLVDNLKNPVRMFPFAKTFAEEATPEEVIRTTYVLMQDAKNSSLLSLKQRAVSLNAAASISGLTPDEKSEQILSEYAGDFYEPSVYDFLTLRYHFIRDALLEPILSVKHDCPKCKDKAVGYYEKLVSIVESPYTDNLSINIPALLVKKKVDPTEVEKLKERIEGEKK